MASTWVASQTTTSTPHCALAGIFIDPLYLVQCIGIDQTNLYEVTAILTEIKYRYSDKIIDMQVMDSVGVEFPDDIFLDYNIVSLTMTRCGFTELPYGLLSNLHKTFFSLDFCENRIVSIDPEKMNSLPFADNLSQLHLHSNNLTKLPQDAFANYSKLTSLTLQNNPLQELVDNTFRGLTSLKMLHLYGNEIENVSPGAFAVLPQLQLLTLDLNRIQFLEPDTFSKENQANLMEIPLEGNPFNCTCSLQWLKDYLISISYLTSSGATCLHPRIGSFAAIDFCA